MAGPRNDDPVRWPSFPDGLNNVREATDPPVDEDGRHTALLDAVNVSLTATGKPKRRPGQIHRIPGRAHSLFSGRDHLFGVTDGVLGAYRAAADGALTLDVALATPGDRFVTYATDDYSIWWSNGIEQGRIDEDLSVHPLWIDTPAAPLLALAGAGGLARGRYEVTVVAVDAAGRESGASGPVGLQVPSGQGIVVTLPNAPQGTSRWRVYVTPPNGEVFYQVADLPPSATTTTIGHHAAGARCETLWLHPLLPCKHMRFGHNRIFGLANNVLIWSQEYRPGLMHPDNHIVLGDEATLLEPVGEGGDGAGCWVADHKRTYFLTGADPEGWRQIARYPHAAVPGTSMTLPGTYFRLETTDPVAFWLARNGTPCIGLPGGELIPLREESLALPIDAERGATGLMLFEGIRQLLTTTISASANLAAASDSADATVRRRTA